ncbi:MAG: hypothetical protein WBJ84_05890 [Bacteroidales bacterium]
MLSGSTELLGQQKTACIIDVKGTVIFDQLPLTIGTQISYSGQLSPESFNFSTRFDFIRVRDLSTNKDKNYYAKKPAVCLGCTGTRGKPSQPLKTNFIQFITNPVLIFGSDTILHDAGYLSSEAVFATYLEFSIPEHGDEKLYGYIGNNDSLIISHSELFRDIDLAEIKYPSILMQNVRLIQKNTQTGEIIHFDEDNFLQIYFFEDIVNYLYDLGFNDEEVYDEITTGYINLNGVRHRNTELDTEAEAEVWLKEKIQESRR